MTDRSIALIIALVYVISGTWHAHYAVHKSISDGIVFFFFLPVSWFPIFIFFTASDPFLALVIYMSIAVFLYTLFFKVLVAYIRSLLIR